MQPERNWETISLEELEARAGSALEAAAAQLHQVLVELASRLAPFPRFLNMSTIQAVELEPVLRPAGDRGCVVVCPDGEIRQLELTDIPGAAGVGEVEQVEEFRELDLPAEEYVLYASTAVRVLSAELRRRER